MRQVIANMTVGKDVSALFADVVNCIQTDIAACLYIHIAYIHIHILIQQSLFSLLRCSRYH